MASKHVHKFRRHAYKTGNKVFFCTLPDCNFKIEVPLSFGKSCICNRCGNAFQINEYSIRMANPHCNDCIVRKGSSRANSMAGKESNKAIATSAVESLRERLSSASSPTSIAAAVEEYPEVEDEDL